MTPMNIRRFAQHLVALRPSRIVSTFGPAAIGLCAGTFFSTTSLTAGEHDHHAHHKDHSAHQAATTGKAPAPETTQDEHEKHEPDHGQKVPDMDHSGSHHSASHHDGAHDDGAHGDGVGEGHHDHTRHARAPIGVMGDHIHPKGQFMMSYRFMRMHMEGSRIGTRNVSPQTIVTTVPNRFLGQPMQPPTLRVVPTKMTTDMHMFGAMYAPTNNLTLMGMVNYIEKEMDHLTFMGRAGTAIRGGFTTRSEGFGDVKLTGLYRLYDDPVHHLHLNLGLSIPTGDITKRDTVLAPTGMRPNLRLPYAMQLGTGTFDLLPGLTYAGSVGDVSWGAQYRAEIRLEDENNEGYAWGDKHAVTAWVAYQWAPWISTSLRLDAMTQDSIDGFDANIVAPVQTADPDNYGGERVDAFIGVTLSGQSGAFKGHRLALEVGTPIFQDLNGPQLETDWTVTLGWQKLF